MMEQRLTIRIDQTDADNIIAIADAMRSCRRPFPTRTETVKLALAVVAADATRFVPPLMAPQGHPWRGGDALPASARTRGMSDAVNGPENTLQGLACDRTKPQ
jgi:hypothetical protein